MEILDFIGFRYCPRCGEARLQPNNAKSFVCTSCGFVYYHSSAAVVAAIIEYEDKIILTHRANEPQKGTLALPGGFVDYEEDLECALIRELQEELNIKVSTPIYLCSYGESFLAEEVVYFCTVAFYVVRVSDLSQITARDDIDAFVLVRLGEIDPANLGFESDRLALDTYRKHDPNYLPAS